VATGIGYQNYILEKMGETPKEKNQASNNKKEERNNSTQKPYN
jgi:hypothetical protein